MHCEYCQVEPGHNKNNVLMRCIAISLRLLRPELTMATTIALSVQHCIVLPRQRPPHRVAAIAMGINSFSVMWTAFQFSGHGYWNHSLEDEKAPQPHPPDASEVTITSGGLRATVDNRLTPFQPSKNHHSRSGRKPLFRRTKWCNSFTVVDRSIIRRKNERPSISTRHAC